MATFTGGCLCGHIRYEVSAEAANPHYCSCRQCQRWSGAPIVAWVDFPRSALTWVGRGGWPMLFRSSARSQRGHCSKCGGTVCALDDGADTICITIATLDRPDALVPVSQSYRGSAPRWLRIEVE